MEALLATTLKHNCVLIYGDCHAHRRERGERPHCAKTDAINCGDLLLGRELYRSYRNDKAILFLPEWTQRWHEVFQQQSGFSDRVLAREFMQESQQKLVYIDTGLMPVPEDTLRKIADFVDMPMEILTISISQLRQTVHRAVELVEAKAAHAL